MKAAMSLAGITGFFVNHGEKVVVAIIGILAAFMMWWGVSAASSMSVDRDRTPEAIGYLAKQAGDAIEALDTVPVGRAPKASALAPKVDPWKSQHVRLATPSQNPLVFTPVLSGELQKRTRPTVFPIADLRAVAGVAVFADAEAEARAAAQPVTDMAPEVPSPLEPAPNRRGVEQEPSRESVFGGGGFIEPIVAAPQPDEPVKPGRIAPFVVVTGLIPAAKQQTEYAAKFGSASFRDARRDSPRWADYRVERAEVIPGKPLQWKNMRLVNVSRLGLENQPPPPAAEPSGATPMRLHPETLPSGFFLQAGESDVAYAAALPERVDGGWGEDAIHPWFIPKLREAVAAQGTQRKVEDPNAIANVTLEELTSKPGNYLAKEVRLTGVSLDPGMLVQPNIRLSRFLVRSADGSNPVAPGAIGTSEKLVFATSEDLGRKMPLALQNKPRLCNFLLRVDPVGKTPVARLLEIEILDDAGDVVETERESFPDPVKLGEDGTASGGGQWMHQQQNDVAVTTPPTANRLFRFVDLNVVPGAEYRYRVLFQMWNPNIRLAPQHVSDVAITKDSFLIAEYSPETATVRVPETTRLLARTLSKDAAKKLKVRGDSVEVIVMDKSEVTGNYALRLIITSPGGSANVDPKLNRPADLRHFGEPVVTDRILVDVRGAQEERNDSKSATPAEPLEMLFLRPDGTFDIVTAADSERFIRKYRSTLFRPGEEVPQPPAKK